MIQSRLRGLTAAQRSFLAARLNVLSPEVRGTSTKQLVAWVSGDTNASEVDLRTSAAAQLPSAYVPRRFISIEFLPRTASGKIDRRKLAASENVAPVEKTLPTKSRVEEQLSKIWSEVLGTGEFTQDDNFFYIGGDSMGVIKLVALCQEAGLTVTPGMVHDNPTIAQLATAVNRSQRERTPPEEKDAAKPQRETRAGVQLVDSVDEHYWERVKQALQLKKAMNPVRLSTRADRPCLFLIPPKGHYFDNFRYLAAEISNYTCYSPYSPQKDIVEHRTVEEMVPEFLGQIRRQQPSGPYRIAGHCEGAYLSWSIAIELMDAGERVEFLGILDTPNPSGLKPKHEPFLNAIHRRFGLIRRGSIWGIGWRLGVRAIDWVSRRVRQAFTKELHLTRIGTRMAWLYRPQPYAGHTTLFRIIKKNHDTIFETDITHGWGEVADGGLDICSIPGSRVEAFTEDHFLSRQHSKVLAQRIQSAIESTNISTRSQIIAHNE
jgi:aryl carrier-like protein